MSASTHYVAIVKLIRVDEATPDKTDRYGKVETPGTPKRDIELLNVALRNRDLTELVGKVAGHLSHASDL